MDLACACTLIELNNRFYADHAASFSATRSAPWEGWRKAAELLEQRGWGRVGKTPQVLDLACGNLRFEHFLRSAMPDVDPAFHAVDACPGLAQDARSTPGVTFHWADVLQDLLAGDGMHGFEAVPPCDLSVTFGFMHHVPGAAMRRAVLELLLDRTARGGIVIISFWQFMNDGRLARKALAADAVARERSLIDMDQLDRNDHFLGWQSDPSPLRYCHHFGEEEIDGLVASVGTHARELARYSADGSSGTLNRYLVLERTA